MQYMTERGYSRVQTTKSGTIEREKVADILRTLDDADFMTLDGRAFFWAFDTPSVGIRVSIDGRTKEVISDAVFVGAPKGRQARFVEATRKVDAVLASATWVTCEGECGTSNSSR